ncbi:UDP-glucose dehydrogenase family protein [Mesobacillus subterraneus]|uniref:UDP-glucose 6-dehydrogenase n=1 Tax=Mesobacillus subterraneus TaxID=285983 RepID=A0A0D6Z718_9BACI|nr:UDP-glucose/GDP-mannose dehydrogenase family protein [Mesobacillus subterraneus]KIY20816.1 UDP-glucose 6-dehydrogenase [Mesobacillus subterraneus]
MKICVIGTGYVGLTTGTVLSDLGHDVYCVDNDRTKIEKLNEGKVPIYEPGLSALIDRNKKRGRLHFLSDIHYGIKECPIIYITVGTPTNEDGSQNLTAINDVIDSIGQSIHSHKTIITKSTVIPGTNEWIHQTLMEKGIDSNMFDIVSNPEFLREGNALADMLNPDKIVVGVKRQKPIETIKKLYAKIHAPYIITSLTGAEMIKYASNAFLATKISFMNEMARICDAYDVEISHIASALGRDKRIGPYFLHAGLGYGGSCFPKDVRALEYAAKQKDIIPEIVMAVQNVNDSQINLYLEKLTNKLTNLNGKKISVWGLAFKPETDDTRESRSLLLIKKLLEKGAEIHAFDPIVQLSDPAITVYEDMYEAVKESDALIIATEWSQFKSVDWKKVKDFMKGNILVDGRNIIDRNHVAGYQFHYIGVAR